MQQKNQIKERETQRKNKTLPREYVIRSEEA